MNKNYKIKITVLLVATLFGVNTIKAQVSQTFRFLDVQTNKPISDVEIKCGGADKAISNSKGFATINYKNKKLGERFFVDYSKHKDYISLGMSLKELTKKKDKASYIGKDTVVYYLVSKKQRDEDYNTLFSSTFKSFYDNSYSIYMKSLIDTLKINPQLLDTCYYNTKSSIDNVVSSLYDNVDRALYNYYFIDDKIKEESMQEIRKGNIKEAFHIMERKIDTLSDKEANLEGVCFYIDILNLDDNYSNSVNLLPYYRLLYENNYRGKLNSTGDYLWYLAIIHDSNEFENIYNKEINATKDSYSLNRIKVCKAVMKAVNNDKACIDIYKEVVNGMEEINNKEDGAITDVLEGSYSSLAYFYRMTQDTNNIIKCYDKAIDYAKQNKDYDKQTKNNTIIDYLKKEIDYLTNEETILDRFNETMSLVRDNYLLDTTNMINKIKYACFIETISQQNTDVIKDSSYTEDLKCVIPIEEEYETTYPYYFTKECFNSKMNLINKTRYEEVEKMQKDVNDLQKQYDKEEEVYGDLLIYNDYNVNKYRKQIAQYKGDSVLYNDYIEKEKALNEKYAKYDYISSVIDNAKTYNDYAEYLYSQEKYDASLAYYDKAIEVNNTLAQKDNKYYASIGSILLQKGDAYLYTKQYDKAIETYNKVIELESKVNEENKETYREDVAGALFFIGDAERAKENYKKALSYYDKAEKEYTTMSQKGKDVYQSFGELNMSRAYTYLSMKKEKKARECFVNSYENYNKAPKDLISNKYLIVINTLNKYYEQDNDLANYVKTKEKYAEVLANYVQQDMGYLPNYINSQIDLGDIFSAIHRYPQADTSYNYALGGLSYMKDYMKDNGQNTDASYLKVAYKAAKIETSIDSFDSAINHLKECIDKSKSLYQDTAIDKYNNYTKDLYYELSRAYYFRGANNEENQQDYKKAKWAMDSSILILNSMNYKQDTLLTYDMSDRQRFLGIICSSINELTQSENALNEAISLILPYYKTNKETLEPAIISDYVLLGNLYYKLLKDNNKAKKSYYQAMSYYDNVSKKDKENSIRDYKQAVESLLSILAYDEDMKDKKEIERLKDINTKLRKLVPDEQE